ncbi:hypothetical protein CG51_09215 [Haematobacter missouriensis]|nr:hypothetical protein CG51_09215 [Haematobacter missouriensis]
MLACWRAGVLACWRAGVLACWRAGVLACWRAGEHARTRSIVHRLPCGVASQRGQSGADFSDPCATLQGQSSTGEPP